MDNKTRSKEFENKRDYVISERTLLLGSSERTGNVDKTGYRDGKDKQEQTRNVTMVTADGAEDGSSNERKVLLSEDSLRQPDSGYNSTQEKGRRSKPSRLRLLTVMTSCLLLQFLPAGTEYGLPVMYVEIIEVFKASRAEAALIQSVFSGVMLSGGILFGGMLNKLGPGISVILGSLLACAGFIVSAFSVNVTMVIVFVGFVAGLGMSLSYMISFVAISWIFHKDAGIPLVFLTVGSSIGHIVTPYLFEIFITQYRWDGAFIVYGAFLLNAAVCGVVIYGSRDYYVIGDDHLKKKKVCDPVLFKDVVLMNVIFSSFLVGMTGVAEPYFVVDIMNIRGFQREDGSLFASVIGVANLVGRVMGVLLRMFVKIPTIWHWSYVCILLALSHVLMTVLLDYWGIFGAVVLYGVAYGITIAQTPAIVYEASGLERYPQAITMLNVMYGIGNLLGGVMGGAIQDGTGSYDLMFYIATGSCLFVSVSTVIMMCILRMIGSDKFVMQKTNNSPETDTPMKYSSLRNNESWKGRSQTNG